LTVAPATSLPADLHRNRLAGQQRLVERRLAFDNHAVARNLVTGPDDEQVADLQVSDRNERLDSVAQHARVLGAELEELADRLRGTAPRARLKETPEQDQGCDHRGDFEVGVLGDRADEDDRRPGPGGERAE